MTALPPDPAAPRRRLHVLVVGGGASGAMAAAHLLRQPGGRFRVTLIERAATAGPGLAYSTEDPEHLLNTRVHNMSALADDPHHFQDWLARQPEAEGATGQCFVSRALYGRYLASLTEGWQGRLRRVRAECLRLETGLRGVVAWLDDRTALVGDVAMLATGHALPQGDEGLLANPWGAQPPVDPGATVAIIGTGLTMVDQVLTLLASGHRGPIRAISRRGLLPRPHIPTRPLNLSLADVPLGAPVSHLLRWLRGLARQAEAQGGTWRDAVDGLRPHVRAIWRALPLEARTRFLRHGAAWWDVHRHRMPPSSARRLGEAMARGQLQILRGAFRGAEPAGEALRLTWRPRGAREDRHLTAARIVDCRGILRDPLRHASPVVADLVARGRARIDPLGIGLEVAGDSRVVDAAGRPDPRLIAIGPVARAAFWEITAVPDIRAQVAGLAGELAQDTVQA